jgi:hypothetical protein
LGTIHAFKCHYSRKLILKTAATLDGGMLQDAAQMKLDVLFAIHIIAETWGLKTPTTIKNGFMKCHFSIDNFSNNDDSSVKLSEDEEDEVAQFTTP